MCLCRFSCVAFFIDHWIPRCSRLTFDIFPVCRFPLLWSRMTHTPTMEQCIRHPFEMSTSRIWDFVRDRQRAKWKSCEWYVKINHYSPLSNLFACSLVQNRSAYSRTLEEIIPLHYGTSTKVDPKIQMLYSISRFCIIDYMQKAMWITFIVTHSSSVGHREGFCFAENEQKFHSFVRNFLIHVYTVAFIRISSLSLSGSAVRLVFECRAEWLIETKCSTVNIHRRTHTQRTLEYGSKQKIISDRILKRIEPTNSIKINTLVVWMNFECVCWLVHEMSVSLTYSFFAFSFAASSTPLTTKTTATTTTTATLSIDFKENVHNTKERQRANSVWRAIFTCTSIIEIFSRWPTHFVAFTLSSLLWPIPPITLDVTKYSNKIFSVVYFSLFSGGTSTERERESRHAFRVRTMIPHTVNKRRAKIIK